MPGLRRQMCVVLLGLSLAAGRAQDAPQATLATPAQQFQALLKDSQTLPDEISKATTDQTRRELMARQGQLPLRFVELADKYPQEPGALEALLQTIAIVNGTAFPDAGPGTPGDKALALILREHIQSPKLGKVCQHVLFGFHKKYEHFLRTVLASNPHAEVQGLACLSLAQFLLNRKERMDILEDQDGPALQERYVRVFGKDYLDELRRRDREAEANEAEALLVRAAENYREISIPVTYYGSGGTVGAEADSQLYQIRHLALGKVAPDIQGQDQNGETFKLSEYRGKVVLLDFWHHL